MIRTIEYSDFDIIADTYNNLFKSSPISAQYLITNYLCHDCFDKQEALIYEENGDIQGVILGLSNKLGQHELSKSSEASIIFLHVFDDKRNDEISYNLLTVLLDYWKKFEIKEVHVGYSPLFYLIPGVEKNSKNYKFLKENNFNFGEKAIWMELDLINYKYPPKVKLIRDSKKEEGFSFNFFHFTDSLSLLEFVSREFSAGWKRNIAMAIKSSVADKNIIICKYDNKIVGYVQISYDKDSNRFGPFGIDKKFRNHQLGTILLHEMLHYMKESGKLLVYFKSTNEPGARFYKRNGFVEKYLFVEAFLGLE